MVDTVNIAAAQNVIQSSQRAQTAGIAALRQNQQQTQAVIDQLQKSLDQAKNITTGAPSASTKAPRGTFLDISV
jgi:hypothetical protein